MNLSASASPKCLAERRGTARPREEHCFGLKERITGRSADQRMKSPGPGCELVVRELDRAPASPRGLVSTAAEWRRRFGPSSLGCSLGLLCISNELTLLSLSCKPTLRAPPGAAGAGSLRPDAHAARRLPVGSATGREAGGRRRHWAKRSATSGA